MRSVLCAIAGLVLTTVLGSRAAAQTADAAAAPDASVDGAPPAAPVPPLAPPTADSDPDEPNPVEVRPSPVPPPQPVAAPAPVPGPPEGPGDEEAKADFQHARLVPDGSPLRFAGRHGFIALYGLLELDYLRDSTQSFDQAANNFGLAHPGTPRGINSQDEITFCNSRLGLHLGTPEDRPVGGAFVVELGPSWEPGDGEGYFCNGRRLRHLYVGLRSPFLDVLAGRYYSLFGWGGKGFFPNTAAFLGVPGQVYRLEPQVRVSHIFRTSPVDIELAGSVSGAPQYVSGAGEGTLAVRVAVNGWRGASAQGGGPPVASPLQVGIAAVGRHFAVSELITNPVKNVPANGGGVSLDVFAPLIPARGADLANALSFTLELSWGTGLSDMYPGLTGGVLFPALPSGNRTDPNNPPPVYTPNIEPGILTFDADGRVATVDWRTLLVGLQYHLPFANGRRVWVSANGSFTRSDNLKVITPPAGWGGIFTDASYFDANAFFAPVRALQIAVSYQRIRQTFPSVAVAPPSVTAENRRGQVGVTYLF